MHCTLLLLSHANNVSRLCQHAERWKTTFWLQVVQLVLVSMLFHICTILLVLYTFMIFFSLTLLSISLEYVVGLGGRGCY